MAISQLPQTEHRPPHGWGRLSQARQTLVLITITLVVVGFVGLWFYIPIAARDYLNAKMANLPDYTGHVDRIGINLWNASADAMEVKLRKKTGEVPVPFFDCPRIRVTLQWSQVLTLKFRSSITAHDPVVNFVTGDKSSGSDSQLTVSKLLIDELKSLLPFRINRIRVKNGEVHLLDFHADPKIDLVVTELNVDANNITNSTRSTAPYPTTVKVSAHPLKTGNLTANLDMNLDEKLATFNQKLRMDHVPAAAANSALQKYGKVQAQSGLISLDSEIISNQGVYTGYVKPFIKDIVFAPKPDDQGTVGSLWAGLLNGVKNLFENKKDVVATKIQVSGELTNNHIDVLGGIYGVLKNAYVQGLQRGLDPITQVPSTDTPPAAEIKKPNPHPG